MAPKGGNIFFGLVFNEIRGIHHSAAIELRIHRDGLEMTSKYSVEQEVLYSYLYTKEFILHLFSDLTNYNYPFIKMLDTNSMDVGVLKKHPEDYDSATDVE